MLTKQGENTHYSLVKRLSALLYDQNRYNESKHFCEPACMAIQGENCSKGTSLNAKDC